MNKEFNGTDGDWNLLPTENDLDFAFDIYSGKNSIASVYDSKESEANAKLMAASKKLLEALQEAKLQIEYLHRKFKETGSGNAVLVRIDNALNEAL